MLTQLKKLIHSWKTDEAAREFYKSEIKQILGYLLVWLIIYIVFLYLV